MAHELLRLGIALAVVIAVAVAIDTIGQRRKKKRAEEPVKIDHATIITLDGTLELTLETIGSNLERFWLTPATALELGRALSIEGARATQARDEGDDLPRARVVGTADTRDDARELLALAVTCRACGLRWTWKARNDRPKACPACEGDELDTDQELDELDADRGGFDARGRRSKRRALEIRSAPTCMETIGKVEPKP